MKKRLQLSQELLQRLRQGFSPLLSIVLISSIGFSFLVRSTYRESREDLVTLEGHLKQLNYRLGNSPESTVYTFYFKEFGQQFTATGIKEVDQNLLTTGEKYNSWFKLKVEKSLWESQSSSLPLFYLASSKNIYLEKDFDVLELSKDRIAYIAFGAIALLICLWIYRKWIKPRNHSNLDTLFEVASANPFLFFPLFQIIWIFSIWVILPAGWLLLLLTIPVAGTLLTWLWLKHQGLSWLDSFKSAQKEQEAQFVKQRPQTDHAPDYVRAVEFLVKSGARLDAHDPSGKTPLHIACSMGHLEAVSLLLKNGAHPNVQDHQGETPLMLAVANRHLGVVELLITQGAKVGIKNLDQQNAIHYAEIAKHPGLLDLLKRTLNAEIAQPKSSSDVQ